MDERGRPAENHRNAYPFSQWAAGRDSTVSDFKSHQVQGVADQYQTVEYDAAICNL